MNLFNLRYGTVLHSGDRTDWLIDCDALTDDDLKALAHVAHETIGPWGYVEGVPRGGLRFADACARLATPGQRLLVVDDVCTTGTSLEEWRQDRDALGLVIFARGPVPAWATALFSTGGVVPPVHGRGDRDPLPVPPKEHDAAILARRTTTTDEIREAARDRP